MTYHHPSNLKSACFFRKKLLNVPGDIDHEALDNIPHRIIKTSLGEIPTMEEMARAIAGLKDGKAPGGDGIPADV